MQCAGNEGGMRLRLIIADYGLQQWSWEYTYLDLLGGPDSMRGFLALDLRVSFLRHEPLPHPHPRVGQIGAVQSLARWSADHPPFLPSASFSS